VVSIIWKEIKHIRNGIMENIVKMSMDGYMESLAGDIEQIKAHPEKGCCDAVEAEVLENVLGIMNSHFSDYDTLCSENKAMAEFLASLGYSQEQISNIANGGNPKTEIELLREEVAEMEKQPMANASALERFKRKIESLENANIPKEAMMQIESRAKLSALEDVYSDIPSEIDTEELWRMIMDDNLEDIEDLTICENYECCPHDIIKEQLDCLFRGYRKSALEAINLVKNTIKPTRKNINTLSFYEINMQELSEDVIAMLDGEADFVYTGLGNGSMMFYLDTLQAILESYEEDNGDDGEDTGSDTSYREFSLIVKLVSLNGCKGLFLTNGVSHE